MLTQRENFSHRMLVDGELSEGGLVDQSSVIEKRALQHVPNNHSSR